MIRRPPRSTQSRSSAASDVYKRQALRVLFFLVSLPPSGVASLKSTNSMIAISAASPCRNPVLTIRVYPPGRSPTFGPISLNSFVTASLFCREEKTCFLLW
eukprot:TRINITY_DN11734_c0_g1_i1.p2 TRINITY_DN11734_c0_g1~~TRINITY_DN11734_c0_g1_i1.p2  ORF type:complete len:101 (-),score=5.77 TRINITY_DN11734_c0_g1_i1:383-685(-)